MAQARTVIGLDVHAAKIVAATLNAESGELRWFSLGGSAAETAKFCAALPAREQPMRPAHELWVDAGARPARGRLGGRGSPRSRERAARVKTDCRDAEHLAWMLLAGKRSPVGVPGCAEEALRDFVRARGDVRCDLMRARHRLSKLLLRRGLRYGVKTS